jgi:hypothetical protein
MQESMSRILLIGTELPLLEGLAQSFASLGFTPVVAQTLADARYPPLVAVVSRTLAAASSAETLTIPLAPGGALVLYRAVGSTLVTFSASVQRAVLADLTLPLERNRLMALVQYVEQRARVTGRSGQDDRNQEVTPA